MRAAAEPLLPYLAATAGASRGRKCPLECSLDGDSASSGAIMHGRMYAELLNLPALQTSIRQDFGIQSTLDLACVALAPSTGVDNKARLPQTLAMAAMQLAGSCALARAVQAPDGLAAVTYLDLHACGLRDSQVST